MTVALKITVDADSTIRTLRALDFTQRQGRRTVGRGLDRMAFRVLDNATRVQIIRGGKGPPHPTRLTSRTGTGRRSIRVNRSGAFERSVGTDLVYMGVHELGGRFHPPRPYLAPALAAVSGRFDDDMALEIQRLIDSA